MMCIGRRYENTIDANLSVSRPWLSSCCLSVEYRIIYPVLFGVFFLVVNPLRHGG